MRLVIFLTKLIVMGQEGSSLSTIGSNSIGTYSNILFNKSPSTTSEKSNNIDINVDHHNAQEDETQSSLVCATVPVSNTIFIDDFISDVDYVNEDIVNLRSIKKTLENDIKCLQINNHILNQEQSMLLSKIKKTRNMLLDLEDKTKYLKHQYFNMKEAYDELKFNHRKMCSEYNILSGNNPMQANKPLKSNLSKVVENV
jgi:hypothetical protein